MGFEFFCFFLIIIIRHDDDEKTYTDTQAATARWKTCASNYFLTYKEYIKQEEEEEKK